jgi:hypothetical protein
VVVSKSRPKGDGWKRRINLAYHASNSLKKNNRKVGLAEKAHLEHTLSEL